MKQMTIEGIPVTVIRKKIRSMNLYVRVPEGEVRVSVPNHGKAFWSLMTTYIPDWKQRRIRLNQSAV